MVSLNNKSVIPAKYELESEFNFRCYPGISCFTRCCRNIELLLTPYDVIRMKNRLGLSSTEFLARYTRYREDEKTTHPLVFIKMNEDEQKLCPFVAEKEGCRIYTDRPAACRYYPVGQATHRIAGEKEDDDPVHQEFYVIVKEDHCRGFDEDRQWTIGKWREDQEAARADELNLEWKNIMMKQNIPREDEDRERRQKMFYLASYDIDAFRRYVLESRFLEIFDVESGRLKRIKNNEIELMHFAFDYIKYMLGISQQLKLKPQVAESQRRAVDEKQAREAAERAAREARIREGKSQSR